MVRPIQIAVTFALMLFVGHGTSATEKVFDPSRDPGKDLLTAEALAKAQHKNILLDVGGNWCPWCILLDRTLHEDPELAAAMEFTFVVVHVNWSMDNQNHDFLSRYPKISGYPYFFVLSATGKLLQAQPTDPLEADHKIEDGYNHQAILDFMNQWHKPDL